MSINVNARPQIRFMPQIVTFAAVRAEAIATLDLRHFGAVKIAGSLRLLPRDAPQSPRYHP
jgi:hypothetical protein